jgi:diguanylate cyclase (GGDEF)-like protein
MDSTPIMGQEPRKEFEYFLSRVLMVIRSVTSTRTAVFMLVNHEREQLILEAFESDVPDAITTVRKIVFSNDIVTQIVLNVKPEILTEINPSAELDLIPYYTRSVGTLSFIGVPVFYQNSVVGILCADSDIANAYDHTIVSFLGHFTKLIGGLVHSYTEKYDLMQASRALTAINNLRSITGMQGATMDSIYEAIIDSVSNLFEYSKIGICGWDDSDNTWRINALKVRDKSEANLLGTVIDIKSSLLGECLSHAKTVFVLPLSENDLRVSQDEHVMTTGFFVAVPLKSLSNNYGAIFIEGKNIGGFNTLDIGILETISNHSGSAIEQLLMTNIMQKSSMIDNNTGLMNTPAFFQRINQELIRSIEFEVPLTVCLIQIDKYLSFDPEVYHERSEQVLIHVLNIIRKRLRPYDIMGRANSNIFGIGLIGVKLQESKIWAERLRSEIAISVMELNTKRFTVTVSIGLAGSHGVTDVNELVSNSYKVLEISKKKSNCVTVFE